MTSSRSEFPPRIKMEEDVITIDGGYVGLQFVRIMIFFKSIDLYEAMNSQILLADVISTENGIIYIRKGRICLLQYGLDSLTFPYEVHKCSYIMPSVNGKFVTSTFEHR